MNIVTFFCRRPEEHPETPDYVGMLRLVQRSCDRLGLRHVVLTDADDLPFECFRGEWPRPLMQSCTSSQADWCARGDWRGADTLFVGADCLILRDPVKAWAGPFDMAVTYRPGHDRYPINTGAVMVRHAARDRVTALFRDIAGGCGPKWGDDQRSFERALSPMPASYGVVERAALRVMFLPMAKHNASPRSPEDPQRGAAMLHFRGKARKNMIFPWAERWLR